MQNRGWIVLKLRTPNRAKHLKLAALQVSFSQAVDVGVQAVAAAGVHHPGEIHHLAYPLARQAGLPSAYARLAVNDITALERKAHRSGQSLPQKRGGFGLPPACYRLVAKNGFWAMRMSVGERGELLWLPLFIPDKLARRLEQVRGDARLFQRAGDWYVALPIQLPAQAAPQAEAEMADITGVDLGVVRLVTAYTAGRVHIVRGLALVQHQKRLSERRRKAVQVCKAERAAQIKLRERRWVSATNHQIANRLVAEAASRPHPIIALEKLDGLLYRQHRSRRFSQMRQAWDFRQLIDLIAYKAQERGVQVVFVDPRGTSTTCPRCRLNLAENASPNGRFHCQGCGYTSITDIVAARNIAARCVQA